MQHRPSSLFFRTLGFCLFSTCCHADIVVLAKSEDALPAASGVMKVAGEMAIGKDNLPVFSIVGMNGNQQVDALVRAGPQPGQIKFVASAGDPSTDSNGNFRGFFAWAPPFTNSAGAAGFSTELVNTLGGSSDSAAIFLSRNAAAPLSLLVRAGQNVPGSPGEKFEELSLAGLNGSAEAAFYAESTSGARSVWRSTSGGSLVRVDNGVVSLGSAGSAAISINDAGKVAFRATGTASLILAGRDAGSLVEIARGGAAIPGGNGRYSANGGFTISAINASGAVAFGATYEGTSAGAADNQGLLLGNGQGTVELVRKGQFVPDGNGRYLNPGNSTPKLLNNAGQVLFRSEISGATGGSNEGIFLASSAGVDQVARVNGPAPGGGTFPLLSATYLLSLDDAGEAVFITYTTTNFGLFSYKAGVLRAIVRHGDTVPGLGQVQVSPPASGIPLGNSRASRAGQVVFKLTYANGGSAVAIWDPRTLIFANGFEPVSSLDVHPAAQSH